MRIEAVVHPLNFDSNGNGGGAAIGGPVPCDSVEILLPLQNMREKYGAQETESVTALQNARL